MDLKRRIGFFYSRSALFLLSGVMLATVLAACSGQGGKGTLVQKPLVVERVKGARVSDVHSIVVVPFESNTAADVSTEELRGLSARLITAFQRNSSVSIVNVEAKDSAAEAGALFAAHARLSRVYGLWQGLFLQKRRCHEFSSAALGFSST